MKTTTAIVIFILLSAFVSAQEPSAKKRIYTFRQAKDGKTFNAISRLQNQVSELQKTVAELKKEIAELKAPKSELIIMLEAMELRDALRPEGAPYRKPQLPVLSPKEGYYALDPRTGEVTIQRDNGAISRGPNINYNVLPVPRK